MKCVVCHIYHSHDRFKAFNMFCHRNGIVLASHLEHVCMHQFLWILINSINSGKNDTSQYEQRGKKATVLDINWSIIDNPPSWLAPMNFFAANTHIINMAESNVYANKWILLVIITGASFDSFESIEWIWMPSFDVHFLTLRGAFYSSAIRVNVF